jgi:hypothetical protein
MVIKYNIIFDLDSIVKTLRENLSPFESTKFEGIVCAARAKDTWFTQKKIVFKRKHK